MVVSPLDWTKFLKQALGTSKHKQIYIQVYVQVTDGSPFPFSVLFFSFLFEDMS